MDLGEKPLFILANAYRIWAHARSPTDDFGSDQARNGVNIYDGVNKVQDFSNASAKSVPSKQHGFQI
jgi:hypothetical protein